MLFGAIKRKAYQKETYADFSADRHKVFPCHFAIDKMGIIYEPNL